MEALKYIKKKYGLRYHVPMPIALPFDRNSGLTGLLNELNLKVGAEIGTSKGRFAKWLFAKINGLKLYCVDPWAVYDEYIELHDKDRQGEFDGYFEETKQRLAGQNVEFIRKYSMDAVKDFKDNSLDFVFIDGNHTFEYVINDIAEWSKKVRPGGIISGHDYWTSARRRRLYVPNLNQEERIKLCQVKEAVNAWTASNHIKPWFITTPNHTDKFPSFLWIKQ